MSDPVHQPSHYTVLSPEPLDVIESWELPHHLACAVKYIARCRYHGTPRVDLEKAIQYLQRYIDRYHTEGESEKPDPVNIHASTEPATGTMWIDKDGLHLDPGIKPVKLTRGASYRHSCAAKGCQNKAIKSDPDNLCGVHRRIARSGESIEFRSGRGI